MINETVQLVSLLSFILVVTIGAAACGFYVVAKATWSDVPAAIIVAFVIIVAVAVLCHGIDAILMV